MLHGLCNGLNWVRPTDHLQHEPKGRVGRKAEEEWRHRPGNHHQCIPVRHLRRVAVKVLQHKVRGHQHRRKPDGRCELLHDWRKLLHDWRELLHDWRGRHVGNLALNPLKLVHGQRRTVVATTGARARRTVRLTRLELVAVPAPHALGRPGHVARGVDVGAALLVAVPLKRALHRCGYSGLRDRNSGGLLNCSICNGGLHSCKTTNNGLLQFSGGHGTPPRLAKLVDTRDRCDLLKVQLTDNCRRLCSCLRVRLLLPRVKTLGELGELCGISGCSSLGSSRNCSGSRLLSNPCLLDTLSLCIRKALLVSGLHSLLVLTHRCDGGTPNQNGLDGGAHCTAAHKRNVIIHH